MIRQLTTALLGLVGPQDFKRLRHPLMQLFAPLLEHRIVSHLLRQGMLEDVLNFRHGGLLIKKLFALQGGKETIEFVFGLREHLTNKAQWKLPPNDGELLQQRLLLWSEAIDTGSEDALHGRRNVKVSQERRAAARLYTITSQEALFKQVLHDLFHEERCAFGLVENELFQRL